MKNLLLVLSLFLPLLLHADKTTDSLKYALTKASGKNKINILNQLNVKLRTSEPKEALRYSELACALALKSRDTAGIAMSLKNMGLACL